MMVRVGAVGLVLLRFHVCMAVDIIAIRLVKAAFLAVISINFVNILGSRTLSMERLLSDHSFS